MLQAVRGGAAVLVLSVAVLVAVPAAAADTVVTLTGETLTATPSATTVSFTCGGSPTATSTLTYDATGVAAGPYPGTFVEHATVKFHEGVIEQASASFRIDAADGTTITGTKQLGNEAPLLATCGPSVIAPEVADLNFFEIYQATIEGPLGSFTESGRAATTARALKSSTGTTTMTMQQGFESGGPPGLTVEVSPATAVDPVGTSYTVSAIVRDATGNPVQGETVLWHIIGSTEQMTRCTTDANGSCSISYLGPDQPSADEITACADTNVNAMVDVGEPCGVGTKSWSPAAATPGGATGGGYIRNSEVAFGFAARAQSITEPPVGGCSVIDRTQEVHVRCLNITSLALTPGHATFFGEADQDGITTNYRIDVDDLSTDGSMDAFTIQTDHKYAASGVLTGGNIIVQP
jgi:hypothetical protein